MNSNIDLANIMLLIVLHHSFAQMIDSRVIVIETPILLFRIKESAAIPMFRIVGISGMYPRVLPTRQKSASVYEKYACAWYGPLGAPPQFAQAQIALRQSTHAPSLALIGNWA